MGRVVRVSETATNLDLVIDDGTGTLEAKLYVDAEEEQNVSFIYAKEAPSPHSICLGANALENESCK